MHAETCQGRVVAVDLGDSGMAWTGARCPSMHACCDWEHPAYNVLQGSWLISVNQHSNCWKPHQPSTAQRTVLDWQALARPNVPVIRHLRYQAILLDMNKELEFGDCGLLCEQL